MQSNNPLISLKPQAVFNSLLVRVTSCSSFCSLYYSALSQPSQLCPNIAGMIKCQKKTNPSLILQLIQLYCVKDLSLLQADSEYDFHTFTCTIQQYNTTGIPSTDPQFHFLCDISLKFLQWFMFFFHIWHLLTSTHKKKTSYPSFYEQKPQFLWFWA